MATIAVLTLLAIAQAVLGRPIDIDTFHDLGKGLYIVVSRFPATLPYDPCSLYRPLLV